jgi:hypothetical protein
MIPTTNKIIQLSPYGLQQAITILKAEFLPSVLISLYSNEVEKWFPFGIHLGHLPF